MAVKELFQKVSSNRNANSGHKSSILTTGALQPASNDPTLRYMTCDICNKTYKTKYIKQHKAVHSKERPCNCSFQGCGAKFKAASNLRRHLRIHRPQPSATSKSSTSLKGPILTARHRHHFGATIDQALSSLGRQIDVRALADQFYLVVVTLKSVYCPVCPVFLELINFCSGMGEPPEFVDPFTSDTIKVKSEHYKFYKTLLRKDAYYIVICPGSNSALHAIQQTSQFEDYPFVPDDEDLSIARSMKLNMSSTEIWPGIIHISQDCLSMFPIYIGRGPGNYGIPALLKSLSDERSKWVYNAYQAIKDSAYQVDRIRRKLRKWQPLSNSRQTEPKDTSLPSELWLDIMDWMPEVRDIMKMREVSMTFNVAACQVIMSRLRANAKHLALCVPPQETIEFDTHVANHVDAQMHPYDNYDQLPGLGELRKQVEIAEKCSSLVNRWVRNARPSLNI